MKKKKNVTKHNISIKFVNEIDLSDDIRKTCSVNIPLKNIINISCTLLDIFIKVLFLAMILFDPDIYIKFFMRYSTNSPDNAMNTILYTKILYSTKVFD